MGAEQFTVSASGETAKQAFNGAVAQAQWDYGHAGYTGTIAEKSEFVLLEKPAEMSPELWIEQIFMGDNTLIKDKELFKKHQAVVEDKWGPAACFDMGDGSFVFFGWASS